MLGIGSGSFDPETLVILETAFDEAWITLKTNGSGNIRPAELARRIGHLAMEGERDPVVPPAWLRTRHTRGIGGSLAGNHPIHALAVRLLRLQPEPELLAHHGGREGAHRVRLPAGGARDGGDGGAARSAQQCQHSRLLRIRPPSVLVAAAGCLRPHLG